MSSEPKRFKPAAKIEQQRVSGASASEVCAASATLQIPLGELPPGYLGARLNAVDVGLNAEQSDALSRILGGLMGPGRQAFLKSGRPVGSKPDAIRWLLEQVPVAEKV